MFISDLGKAQEQILDKVGLSSYYYEHTGFVDIDLDDYRENSSIRKNILNLLINGNFKHNDSEYVWVLNHEKIEGEYNSLFITSVEKGTIDSSNISGDLIDILRFDLKPYFIEKLGYIKIDIKEYAENVNLRNRVMSLIVNSNSSDVSWSIHNSGRGYFIIRMIENSILF